MLRSISSTIVQCRGIKHQVKIKWVRPDYIPSYKPEKSGDLEPITSFPPETLGQDYAMSDEIKEYVLSYIIYLVITKQNMILI